MKNIHCAHGIPAPGRAGTSRHPFQGPARARSPEPHGARLFRISRPEGGFYWEAEMALNGEVVRRRFERELHARAWLSPALLPSIAPATLDLEELNSPFRAGCLVPGI